jgi:hypothetical protein
MGLAEKTYEVCANLLDRVDHSGGYRDDGSPKRRPIEHRKGDKVTFDGYEDDDVQHLLDLGAIKPADEESDEEPEDEESEEDDESGDDKSDGDDKKEGGAPPLPPVKPGA